LRTRTARDSDTRAERDPRSDGPNPVFLDILAAEGPQAGRAAIARQRKGRNTREIPVDSDDSGHGATWKNAV